MTYHNHDADGDTESAESSDPATASEPTDEDGIDVSRRGALGLAGLVGAGGLLGTLASQPAAAVEGHTLEQNLDCNNYELENASHIWAGQNYVSFASRGNGSGNLQLYDANAEAPFLRASEVDGSSDPGPVIFNSPVRGGSEDDHGPDVTPGPFQIADDVDVDGNELQSVAGIEGGVTGGAQLESLAGSNLSITDGQLNAVGGGGGGEVNDELESRLDDAVTRLEVVGGTANNWRVGPTEPSGDYHYTGAFGLVIDVDRPTYLGECTIDASGAGQFSPALYEYDSAAGVLREQIDTVTIQAAGGPQTIFLDFLVEEPGQYLLTRLLPEEDSGQNGVPGDIWKPADDQIELRASEGYGGWGSDSQHGVSFQGGLNPYFGDMDGPNEKWYYYFDLEVSSAEA